MTGKVVWHMTMSLDGFIGDRDDKLDWSFNTEPSEPSELAAEVIRTTGAFLCGGRLVDAVGENRPYGGAWTGPVLIYTHKDPATNPIPEFTYVSGDIRDVVAHGLDAADGKNLVVTGGTVPRLALDAGLVDELVLHIVPVLLGEGIRFYDSPGVSRTTLKVLTTEGTNFRFEVALDALRRTRRHGRPLPARPLSQRRHRRQPGGGPRRRGRAHHAGTPAAAHTISRINVPQV